MAFGNGLSRPQPITAPLGATPRQGDPSGSQGGSSVPVLAPGYRPSHRCLWHQRFAKSSHLMLHFKSQIGTTDTSPVYSITIHNAYYCTIRTIVVVVDSSLLATIAKGSACVHDWRRSTMLAILISEWSVFSVKLLTRRSALRWSRSEAASDAAKEVVSCHPSTMKMG